MARSLKVRDDHLRCRTLGHAWEDFTPLNMRVRWGELLPLRCVRCGMERLDVINALGELGQRTYKQPDGYHLSRDETPTRETLRHELALELKRNHTNQRKARK